MEFVRKHAQAVTGILSGFDRLVFRGTLRAIAHAQGMMGYLSGVGVLLKDFAAHVEAITEKVKMASTQIACARKRPVIYLPSPQTSKEEIAREIVARDRIDSGLICVLKSVEPCHSFEIYRNRENKRLELQHRTRKCLHFYHYFMHPLMGLMHARIQTWFPLSIQVCINGREWLARTLTHKGIAYEKSDNCFPAIESVEKAQKLFDAQLATDWTGLLNRIALELNPAHREIFRKVPLDYYWSAYQSEWATDVMFKDSASLARIYPGLVRHAMSTFGSPDVMRFLGRKIPQDGAVNERFGGEVTSDLKKRKEGVRVKHRVNGNSIKMYDKQGSVLRVETTINETADFKVYRPKEGGPDNEMAWRVMRRGVADLKRRAEVSQAANERYLASLAAVENTTPLSQIMDRLCQPVQWKGKRVRALNPWGEDARLLQTIAHGEFSINGFRNSDLREHLYPGTGSKLKDRKSSAKVTRKLRMLRAHGLIQKVPKTHRYTLTELGRIAAVASNAARACNIKRLTEFAA